MKTENVKFLTSTPQVVLQDIKKSFKGAHWNAKIYWNSPASLWNSTTVTMLMLIHPSAFSVRNSHYLGHFINWSDIFKWSWLTWKDSCFIIFGFSMIYYKEIGYIAHPAHFVPIPSASFDVLSPLTKLTWFRLQIYNGGSLMGF